jgi:hypothetical protein
LLLKVIGAGSALGVGAAHENHYTWMASYTSFVTHLVSGDLAMI